MMSDICIKKKKKKSQKEWSVQNPSLRDSWLGLYHTSLIQSMLKMLIEHENQLTVEIQYS